MTNTCTMDTPINAKSLNSCAKAPYTWVTFNSAEMAMGYVNVARVMTL